MAVCTYDNPKTMQRECWADGRLLCAYSFTVLEPLAKHLIPSTLYFFGANVGPWEKGQVVGDFAAVSDCARIAHTPGEHTNQSAS
jgi:hypothetical protein